MFQTMMSGFFNTIFGKPCHTGGPLVPESVASAYAHVSSIDEFLDLCSPEHHQHHLGAITAALEKSGFQHHPSLLRAAEYLLTDTLTREFQLEDF